MENGLSEQGRQKIRYDNDNDRSDRCHTTPALWTSKPLPWAGAKSVAMMETPIKNSTCHNFMRPPSLHRINRGNFSLSYDALSTHKCTSQYTFFFKNIRLKHFIALHENPAPGLLQYKTIICLRFLNASTTPAYDLWGIACCGAAFTRYSSQERRSPATRSARIIPATLRGRHRRQEASLHKELPTQTSSK